MPGSLHVYDLMKSIVQLSNAPVPADEKLDQMLQSVSGAFQSDRCLFLKPEKIDRDGFLSRVVSGKKPLWIEKGSSFQKENVSPHEEELLCPTFACLPLFEDPFFQG